MLTALPWAAPPLDSAAGVCSEAGSVMLGVAEEEAAEEGAGAPVPEAATHVPKLGSVAAPGARKGERDCSLDEQPPSAAAL